MNPFISREEGEEFADERIDFSVCSDFLEFCSCKLEVSSVERLFCNWYQDSQGLELWPPPVFMGVGDQRQEMLTDARHHATAGLTGRVCEGRCVLTVGWIDS